MKLAICTNCVPFLRGGAEHLASALEGKLREYGHQATTVRVPFRWEPVQKILECMLACRLMRLPNVDRVIALKFPAYLIPHPDKVLWLLHQFRQAYDLWGTPYHGFPGTAEGTAIRNAIVGADSFHLSGETRIYTNSRVTSDRLMRFNGLPSQVLYPPLLADSHFTCGAYGEYIFYPSRITASKRQALLVRSMVHVRTPVRAVIAGHAEAAADLAELEELIARFGLGSRVTLLARFISEEEKAGLFSDALACAYLPYDEDSYGYVTLESYAARKPVISCTDSGGTDLLVKDGLTGCLVEPEPKTIAAAIDKLYLDKSMARRMGEAGADLVSSLNISWDHVIGTLTA